MPRIQNVAFADIPLARHMAVDDNSMLIQIVDPGMPFAIPRHKFKEIHQFEFLDVEKNSIEIDSTGKQIDLSEFAITQEQANQLVNLLQHALNNDMDVVVHCVAGVCRSGAVCEVGVMMGFLDTKHFRSPNLLVKHHMMKKLGWTYEEDEPHTINGAVVDPDWIDDNEKVFTLAAARRHYRKVMNNDYT
jgi:predicted protein tyrosine phosphatase